MESKSLTWLDADKIMYFVWHHCFHLLLNANIDNTSNGVDGFCGKHYSQDFISFLNDAGDHNVFTALLSEWDECPGRPKVYSPCISLATLLFPYYICSRKENIQRAFRTEVAVNYKPPSYEIGLFPSEVERKHNYTNELSFTGRPAGYSEIHIDLDLQRLGIQLT